MSVPLLLRPVYQLEISLFTANMLKAQNIHYIGDLVYRTEAELLKQPGIAMAVAEIKEALAARNLALEMRPGDLPEEMGPNPIVLHVVDELEVSPGIVDTLKAENIHYIGDLTWRTEVELSQRPNISSEMLTALREALRVLGLDFRKR